MAQTPQKSFKISDLPLMTDKDLTYDDLFMMSDNTKSSGQKEFKSKAITYGQLSAVLQDQILKSRDAASKIQQMVRQYASIQTWLDTDDNNEFVLDGGSSN